MNTWHDLGITEVLTQLNTTENGIGNNEAMRRKSTYGSNQLVVYESANLIMRFLRQFHNILIYILIASALITLYLGKIIDSGVILIVIVLNAIFGFIQEGKAEKALQAIRNMLAPKADVIRDGNHLVIPATELVPGDIVLLKSGDKVPADLRLIKVKNLQIQEASLTGESLPVEKFIDAVATDAALGDRTNMAYSSTLVISGKGSGVVVATGSQTEIGKISDTLTNIPTTTTPLLQQINIFGYWLTLGIVLMALGTFLVGAFVWHDTGEQMFMAIVSLTVAAIPEGLPPIITIILAIGVMRMAKHNAIVRSLPSVETMGSVTTICTDKTGTLTLNELTVQALITAQHCYNISGAFGNKGEINLRDTAININEHPDLKIAILASVLCNEAEAINTANKWHFHGDPVDIAFLMLGNKAKFNLHFEQQNNPRTDLIPYESQHKCMATLHHDHSGKGFIYVKGAPERILEMCSMQRTNGIIEPLNLQHWNKYVHLLAQTGQRVMAVAYKEVSASHRTLQFKDIEHNLTFIAIFGLIDPPREEAADAVAECKTAGVRVKMITGDHAATATTIATSIGIGSKNKVLTGPEIAAMSDEELAAAAADIDIYARTSPEHKLRLVKALQANGEIVAMTGDGVNDAPALHQADIGVAMGHKGTEIAKEAADMVLTDDNFATIEHAVAEGRTVYDNIKKTILYILPTSFAQAFIVIIAVLLGWQLPITPVQILWINMITAITLSLALGFEPAEDDVMLHPPRAPKTPILSAFLTWRVIFVSALLVVAVFIMFMFEHNFGSALIENRTVAVNTIVFGEIVYLLNCRRIYGSVFGLKALLGSKPVLVAITSVIFLQLLFTYLPVLQNFFGTTAIDFTQWLRIICISIIIFLLVETEKFLINLIFRKKSLVADS